MVRFKTTKKMKKLSLLFVCMVFISGLGLAQKKGSKNSKGSGGAFAKGDFDLSIGLTGSLHRNALMVGPTVTGDYALTDDISIGGYLGTYFGGRNYTYAHGNHYHEVRDSYVDFYFGPRAAWHFGRILNMPSKLDWYAGTGFGALIGSRKHKNDNLNDGYVDPGYKGSYAGPYVNVFTGIRYYVKPKLAIYAEANGGYAIANMQFGITFKL